MVSGGGTGGHIYPALALIEDLMEKEPDSKVLYVGSTRGLEKNIVPKKGIPFKELKIQGFKRSFSLSSICDNFKTLYLFLKSVHESKKLIKQFKPDIVIGTGGYVSGAVVYAAAREHIPTMIHEQNSLVGLTNKFLSHFVDKIAIAFHMAASQFPKDKIVFTGNPRAQQAAHIKSNFSWSEYGLDPNTPTVLIFGGSQGALKINSATMKAIPEFNQKPYQVVFVTGQKRYDYVKKQLANVKVGKNVIVKPYIYNMPQVLPKVSLIVGRAGATSLAEITALGIPSILIPSPYVTADHQTKNAMSLVKRGAAEILTEKDLTGKRLVNMIDDLIDNRSKLQKMGMNSKKLGMPDASDRLLKVMNSLIKNNK